MYFLICGLFESSISRMNNLLSTKSDETVQDDRKKNGYHHRYNTINFPLTGVLFELMK